MKWVLRYIKGKSNYCITFDGSSDVIHDCVDLNFAGDLDKEGSHLDIYLLLQVQQIVGCQSFKSLLLNPLHRQSIYLLHMLSKRKFG